MKKIIVLFVAIIALASCTTSLKAPELWTSMQENWTPGVDSPIPSTEPSEAQKAQIARKYGMFIHFGMNTFHDMEWTDGRFPPSTYTPSAIDAAQWVKTAKDAGMTYIILVTKHHEGFALWDSPYTTYDVASSPNITDVLAAVAEECKKQGIELGFYYSLWDRKVNGDVRNVVTDAAYNSYMLKQIEEIMTNYGDICELWLDGGWEKENWRWPIREIYTLTKKHQPNCQVTINWTIGKLGDPDYHAVTPDMQSEGDPIRYFPTDFRIGDPYLPVDNDPKIFTHHGESFYLPWESTICLSQKWFYNTTDTGPKSIDVLYPMWKQCTKNDNILILNVAPGRDGRIRDNDVARLIELKEKLVAEGDL